MLPTRYVFLALLVATQFASAQTITLGDYLGIVRERHPVFEKQRLTAEIERHGRESLLGAQDWMLGATPVYNSRWNVDNGIDPESMHVFGAGATAERAFWKTGGRLSASWNLSYAHSTGSPLAESMEPIWLAIGADAPSSSSDLYQQEFRARYTHPFRRNVGGELDRLAYDLSGFSVDAAAIQAYENQEAFLLSVAHLFIRWAALGEQKSIIAERQTLAESQAALVARKRRANLVDQVDVLRAQDAVRMAEQGVMLIGAQWRAQRAQLAVLAKSTAIDTLGPEFSIYDRVPAPSADEASRELRESSRVLRTLAIYKGQLERQLGGWEEMAKPVLSVGGEFALVGGGSDALEMVKIFKPDFMAFAQYRFPLENRAANANMQKARVQIRQLDLEVANVTLGLEAALKNQLILLAELERVLTLNEQQIETAKARTVAEVRRYNQGRGDLAFVIQSQDNEQQARLTYAENAAAYQGLHLELQALLDILLPSDETPSGEGG